MKQVLFFLLFACSLQAQAQQSWQWLKSPHSYGNMNHKGMDVDANGNVFTIGQQWQSADYGTINIPHTGDYFCLYLAKQDAVGSYLFAKKIWADAGIKSAVIKLDNSGNVFVFGTCNGYTLHLSPTDSVSYSTSLSATDQTKFFLAKYDNNGNFLWAKKGEGASLYATARAITSIGTDIFIGGDYYGAANFLGLNMPSKSSNSSFILKVDNSGNGVWLNAATVTAMTFMTALSNDGTNLYACGKFQNTIGFNSVMVNNPLATSGGGERIFLFKFNSSGVAVWGKEEGGIANYVTTADDANNANTLAYDGNGYLYMGGSYQSQAGTISNQLQEPFVSRYDVSNGNKLWTVKYSGNLENAINGIVIDSNANPICVGEYLGSMTIGNFNLPTDAIRKGMILRLDKATGNCNSVIAIGNTGEKANVQRIYMPANKSYYVISGTYGSMLHIGNLNTTSSGNNTDFVAKYALGNPTGIAQRTELAYQLYPIPARDILNFELGREVKATVSIINTLGQVVYQQNFEGAKGYINLGRLTAGQYYFKIQTKDAEGINPFTKL
ncbi:MAG: T9SS type A sorting domain-containing protein [Taibaiella sp.]|nr:T9SS type A sorting domain-containing protein [Taibaiella sp.]